MSRTPVTPTASPTIDWHQLSGPAPHPVALAEPAGRLAPSSDDSSSATICVAVASALSALLALGVDGQLYSAHPALFRVLAFYYHYVSPFLWAATIALGTRANSKLARFLALPFTVTTVVVFYGWHWLGIEHSPDRWLKLLYGAVILATGLPWLAQRLWRRFRQGAV